jgi:hypothetical protein
VPQSVERERERERDRERERQTERQTDGQRQTDRQTDRQIDREVPGSFSQLPAVVGGGYVGGEVERLVVYAHIEHARHWLPAA